MKAFDRRVTNMPPHLWEAIAQIDDDKGQSSSFEAWLERSTTASGVPLKVTNCATIAALQVLVSGARRTRIVAAQTGQPKTKRP
jgi:hypothetical protein